MKTVEERLLAIEDQLNPELARLRSTLTATEAKLEEETRARERDLDVLQEVRDELESTKSECARLKAETTRAGVQSRVELDEELQQIDDAIEAAGGAKDQGAVAFIESLTAELARVRGELAAPVPMRLPCPQCGELHLDEGEFATKAHHTHACQACGEVWRPAVGATVGVRFLPGFKNETETPAVAAPAVAPGPGTEAQHYAWALDLLAERLRAHLPADTLRSAMRYVVQTREQLCGGTYVTGLELVPGPVKEEA